LELTFEEICQEMEEEEEDVEWWHKWRENRVELDPMTKDAPRIGLALPVQRPFGLTLGGTIYL